MLSLLYSVEHNSRYCIRHVSYTVARFILMLIKPETYAAYKIGSQTLFCQQLDLKYPDMPDDIKL